MREIKFRGKCLFSADWVYGGISFLHSDTIAITTYENVYAPPNAHVVDKETVGQYTGLKDKNGKEIFEGDIITFEDAHCYSSENSTEYDFFKNVGSIKYDNEQAQFFVTNCQSVDLKTVFEYINESEVIGNIQDNPELIEGENNG